MLRALLIAAILFVAPGATEVELSAEPHHHLMFENQYVRVYRVEIPPHEQTLMHWHRHDYGYVMFGAAHVSNEAKGKTPVELSLADGAVGFLSGNVVHVARNLSEQPFRNITVEYLQDKTLRTHPKKWDEERGLEILHGGTKEILFVKDGVRASELELQPGGMIPLHHHAGPHLLIAITDLDFRSDVQGHGAVPGQFKAGEAKWVPGNYSHTLTNTGKQIARFVTFEFP